MQPLQYYLRDPAAKDNGITHAAAAPSNLDAATTMWSAETELQNTIELRATASEIAAPQPDLDAKAKKRRFWSTFKKDFLKENYKRQNWKKHKKSADKSLSQPCDLRDPAAQESSITHAAAVPRNLDAAITIGFAASRRKPARIYARGNIRGRQSCSYSNAICNHRSKKRIELRTQEQPLKNT